MYHLEKIVKRRKKRLGRGYGSGKGGHTSSRGMKGQKSRTSIGILFEGVKFKKSFYKRLPLSRGKGKFKANPNPVEISLDQLNIYSVGSKVNIESLVKKGLVDKDEAYTRGVKILNNGKVTKKLTIEVPISKSATKSITKSGGKVIEK